MGQKPLNSDSLIKIRIIKHFFEQNRMGFMGIGRMALLWILGVPIIAIVVLKLLGLI